MCSSLIWGLSAPVISILMGITGLAICAHLYSQHDFSFILTINAQYGMVILMTVFSCVSLFAGCFGICGVFQYSKQMLTTFWICMIFCLLGYAAAAAVGLAVPLYFYNGGCLGITYAPSQYLNNQTSLASVHFCKSTYGDCKCYLNPNGPAFSTLSPIFPIGSYDKNNYSYPVNVFRCQNWTIGMYDTTFSSMQYNLNCAGWCAKNQFFMFSDVNKGLPERACFLALSDWFMIFASKVYVTCFIFVGICIALIVWMCIYQNYCVKAEIQQLNVLSATMF